MRWDRLGRVAMLIVLGVLVYLYVRPALTWWSTYRAAAHAREQITVLSHENARLNTIWRSLGTPGSLAIQARQLGMIRPGERAYSLRGLPAN